MQTTVTFKKMDSSEPLKTYVDKKLEKFDRLLESPAEAHVVLSIEKIRHIAEITLTCDRLKIHAKEASENMYASIDTLTDKVRAQLKKHKEKLNRHLTRDKQSIRDDEAVPEFQENAADPLAAEHIRIETIDNKPMDVEDAMIELNSGRQSFFVFNNARTEQVNVLYKHHNGKLGLIQPKG